MGYFAHEVCNVLEDDSFFVGFDSDLAEEVDESDSEVQIFYLMVRYDIEEESDEFEEVEPFPKVFREEFNNLNLMLFDIVEDRLDAVLLDEGYS